MVCRVGQESLDFKAVHRGNQMPDVKYEQRYVDSRELRHMYIHLRFEQWLRAKK